MMFCTEVMKAYSQKIETNTKGMKSVVEHQDVPKEEAAVETAGALED
jgi:hypothetical protein